MRKLSILFLAVFIAVPTLCYSKTWEVNEPLNIVFLLDETGSMQERKEETIVSFNKYVDGLKDEEQNINFRLIKFNSNEFITSVESKNLEDVKLNEDIYNPDYTTPLYDAIAKAILMHKKNSSTLFIILTDGLENASTEYTQKDVFEMIEEKKDAGWTFVYLGTNQDAYAEGHSIGISQGNIYDWNGLTISDTIETLSVNTSGFIGHGNNQTNTFFEN